MSVYVDDTRSHYRRMKMCHMLADTNEELVSMADKIGVQRKFLQEPGTYREHFDICMSKREMAIKLGAIEIDFREVAGILKNKRLLEQGQ